MSINIMITLDMYNKEICFDRLTNSLKQSFKKCFDASVENLYVDLGV